MEKKYLNFRTPIEILADPPSEEGLLIGDKHLSKGSVCIIGGAPGVGKSRTSMSLAIAGATQSPWFGLPVHRKFKTMILQSENGAWRLYTELRDIHGIEGYDEYVLVSDPPAYGIRLDEIGFREQFRDALDRFQPDIIVLDPWNSVVSDDKARDFRDAFDSLRAITGTTENDPALVIIHHTRKPKENEKHMGRALLNLFAGSYVIGSVARSAFHLQAATDDPEDNRVVLTCCKNNDGKLGERTVWHRGNGLFEKATNFDWEKFDSGSGGKIITTKEKVLTFLNGVNATRKELVEGMKERHGLGKSSVYNAISTLLAEKEIKDREGCIYLA